MILDKNLHQTFPNVSIKALVMQIALVKPTKFNIIQQEQPG